ncbi:peptidase C14 [Carbonactinospora thermoautotrophica]|uniref:Peptidase C14 n=1 Tax=Carbonactinospora thermoautotrophica TaxID=1469144 RepID=A0A132MQL2_9ACTN|nr:caspase family protein [Carbonactinospora thermoautotrophica]KWX00123.1 peptidase C14 [Carbonactinospora thermoautotrophica]KWX06611.1 peptidase C14 [Carbonactinospora thermoautotrophica]
MPQGLSIHIGLNQVDPEAYDGWSGDLVACEQDARDMAALAGAAGFRVGSTLLTKDATVKNVTSALRDAARTLERGDILFLSYSGHGSQVPDLNQDEADRRDETWVLYDRQLLDDELFELFGGFAAGVRILMLSDSCHSGTVARKLPDVLSPMELDRRFGVRDPAQVRARIRTVPLDVQAWHYRQHHDQYAEIQRSTRAGDRREIGASVLLISGCQDNQTSADGPVNGLFTGTLLQVWQNGRFRGDYRRFHREITALMPPDQTPNLFLAGQADRGFVRQRPFTI